MLVNASSRARTFRSGLAVCLPVCARACVCVCVRVCVCVCVCVCVGEGHEDDGFGQSVGFRPLV
jgi:hypothetical protein